LSSAALTRLGIRDPQRVREDVLDGYVSLEAAERDYGVLIRPDHSIDEEATRRIRRTGADDADAG
jgi:N-methylhydantoinase B/oxoprolinase/acetone carboxylase alpha subunit